MTSLLSSRFLPRPVISPARPRDGQAGGGAGGRRQPRRDRDGHRCLRRQFQAWGGRELTSMILARTLTLPLPLALALAWARGDWSRGWTRLVLVGALVPGPGRGGAAAGEGVPREVARRSV